MVSGMYLSNAGEFSNLSLLVDYDKNARTHGWDYGDHRYW